MGEKNKTEEPSPCLLIEKIFFLLEGVLIKKQNLNYGPTSENRFHRLELLDKCVLRGAFFVWTTIRRGGRPR